MTENIKCEYLNQSYECPKYIFHGSKNLYNEIKPHRANDINKNEQNSQWAIYGSSVFRGAIPYAIKGKGVYDCSIGYEIDDLTMKITYGIIPEDDYGYVYVLDANNFLKCNGTCQYVSYNQMYPIEVIKVYYEDYKDCFEYIKTLEQKKTK